MKKTNELKYKMSYAFSILRSLNEHNKISNIFFNYKKTFSEFENLSRENIDVKLFKASIEKAFIELEKWKSEIEVPENIDFDIEKEENNIGNNMVTIKQTLNNTDKNCADNEIIFQYSINTLNETLGVSVLFLNISNYKEEFVLSDEISSELILKEIVDTFYNYIKSIHTEEQN